MDPWGSEVESAAVESKFEDNFKPTPEPEKLADSAEYLAVLGKYIFCASTLCICASWSVLIVTVVGVSV